ncbi:hypothetical protein [Caloranaerobacter ferrireducens]|nr:hypothetical protein [Caloranaerobacter ferrireducens]
MRIDEITKNGINTITFARIKNRAINFKEIVISEIEDKDYFI